LPYITLKGEKSGLYYELRGEGATVVLINGLTRSSSHWYQFADEMSKNARIVLVDNRGTGRSNALRADWSLSIQQMANDVEAVLEHIECESAHVFGLSMGGMIGMALALKSPQLVRSLTLLNSSSGGFLYPRISPRAMLGSFSAGANARRAIEAAAHYLIADVSPERFNQLVDQWLETEQTEPTSYKLAAFQMLAAARFDVRSRLKELCMPVAVMVSLDDMFVPMRNSEFLHGELHEAEWIPFAKGGHEITVSKPKDVVEAWRKFIASN